MAANAGLSPDLALSTILEQEGSKGINFASNSLDVLDLYEDGIIDPVRVTRVALQNATSVASTLITTNYAIIEV